MKNCDLFLTLVTKFLYNWDMWYDEQINYRSLEVNESTVQEFLSAMANGFIEEDDG